MNWKKITVWAFAVVIVLFGTLGIGTVLLVKQSPSFRQGLLANAERDVYESTGARVAVRDFSLSFFSFHLDLYGVVVHGNEPQFGQPLLLADQVSAGVKMSSLWSRKWSLRDVVVDRPVAHLVVSQAGESNMPQPEKTEKTKANVFDLAIQKLLLHGGEVYFNDKKIPFEAELHNLQSTADFDGRMNRYHAVVSYTEGKIRFAEYAPAVHSLDFAFDAAPAKLTVDHLTLVSDKSRVLFAGSLEDYNNPVLQATYDAQLATKDAEPFLKNAPLPLGVVRLIGSLNYRRDPNRPVLETVLLTGTATSSALAITFPGLRAEARDVGAKYKLAGGNAELENVHAQVLGGKVTGTLSIHDLAGTSSGKLRAQLKDVSLEQLQSAARQDSSPDARLSGRINADVEATWNKTLKDLEARGNATLTGSLGRNPSTPLRGAVHADYAAASQQMTLRQSYIRTPQTSITLDGKVSEQSQMQVSLHSGNLHELELLAENFTAAPFQQPLDLYGTTSFSGIVSGPASAPQLKGQLEAHNLRVKGTSWRLLRADIDATPASLRFSNGNLEAGSEGPAQLQGPPGLAQSSGPVVQAGTNSHGRE